MSKKTLILPLSVTYKLIDETEGQGEIFYNFPSQSLILNEVLRNQANYTTVSLLSEYTEDAVEKAETTWCDIDSIGGRLYKTMQEKGFTLSAVMGLGGFLLYKKNTEGSSFVAKNENNRNWDYAVGSKFAKHAFGIEKDSEEYNFVMDEIEQNCFDDTLDYLDYDCGLKSIPCVVVVFNDNEE